MRRALLALALLAAALAPATAHGQTAATLSLTLSSAETTFGESLTATGILTPAVPGEQIAIELGEANVWIEVGRATVDASGGFTSQVEVKRGGFLRARALTSGVVSEQAVLSVRPLIRIVSATAKALVGGRVTARVRPLSYSGRVSIVVKNRGGVVATASGAVRNGRLRAEVPAPGPGRFTVVLAFPAADGLVATLVARRMQAAARTLTVGASGADVRAVSRRLAQLKFRVPGISSTYSWALYDAVIAFQKAYRLPRTGVIGIQTWRLLGRALPLRPRYRGPAAHIEVDKTRQILLDVRGGEVVAVIPVSTGATGNTPEGRHQIRWKALATTTWLGPAILYRTLTFYGNSFAIHGFPSVPAYPASHGCVRIPIWTADWLYNRSSVGETVYVYR
jgi:lipoprotein-anchoring transpeptidase ErfK/SrfK